MAVIDVVIPVQLFERLRDRIAEILADELANQFVLSGDGDNNATVWLERIVPFDKTDCPAINVSFDRGSYQSQSQISSEGLYTYNIDVFTNSSTTQQQDADRKSRIVLHRIMGICRAILENPRYKTLGFEAPIIYNRHIDSFQIADTGDQDGRNNAMGRLTIVIRAMEGVELIQPSLLLGSDTDVKLCETEKGFKYAI